MKILILIMSATLAGASTLAGATTLATTYMAPVFHAGERFDNVFSRTIAYRATGFDENVRRVGGSASYRFITV